MTEYKKLPTSCDLSMTALEYALEVARVPIPNITLHCHQVNYTVAKEISKRFYTPNFQVMVDNTLGRDDWYIGWEGNYVGSKW